MKMKNVAPVTYVEYAETPLMLMAPFVDQIEVPGRVDMGVDMGGDILVDMH